MDIWLSWCVSAGLKSVGGNGRAQSWDDVQTRLEFMRTRAGSVSLEYLDAPDLGPYSIQVIADSGKYLVALIDTTENDNEVRSYSNLSASPAMVELVGDYWDARMLTSDYAFVVMVFKEFFETGDVSKNLLS